MTAAELDVQRVPLNQKTKALILAIYSLDARRGTESKSGAVGAIRLTGRQWQRLLNLANRIIDAAGGEEAPF